MALSNDSITVTPGSGATVATHLVSAKEHQVVCIADDDGHIQGSKPVYGYSIAQTVHVAAANTVMWDFWNGTGSGIIRVLSVRQIPNIVTAVTGVAFDWQLTRTTAIGTGGTAQTAWLRDLSQTALDANITCRLKPTGGATAGVVINNYQLHGEETNTGTMIVTALGGLEIIPPALAGMNPQMGGVGGILLRPSQGLRCVQVTNNAAGNSAWSIVFTVE